MSDLGLSLEEGGLSVAARELRNFQKLVELSQPLERTRDAKEETVVEWVKIAQMWVV